jgi:hypothetical protein
MMHDFCFGGHDLSIVSKQTGIQEEQTYSLRHN